MCLPGELVVDDFDMDLMTELGPGLPEEALVHPWFEIAHPERVHLHQRWRTTKIIESTGTTIGAGANTAIHRECVRGDGRCDRARDVTRRRTVIQ